MKINQKFYTGSMVWKWADGTTLDYKYWSPGEPNSGDGPDYCGDLWYTGDGKHDGHWDDDQCTKAFRSVCQKRRGIFYFLHSFIIILRHINLN